MNSAASAKAKDEVFKKFHKDMIQSLGDKVNIMFKNKTLDDFDTPLMARNAWFLKKFPNHKWSDRGFRMMMLYKDVCGAKPKDSAYDTVEGLDEALNAWRSQSDLYKFVSAACVKAYTPRDKRKRKPTGIVGNFGAAEEPPSDEDEDEDSNSGTTFGFIKG